MNTKRAIFISFEGPDGAGKSTVIQQVGVELAKKREVVLTREPGGVQLAEDIRRLILNPAHTSLDGKSELLLFAAARRLHLLEKIKPALAEGKLVLVDRFIDSSVAYQGYGRGIGAEGVKWINDFATDGLKPDLTVYFDVPAEVGLARIGANDGREVNRLDKESLDIYHKVIEGYQALLAEEPSRFGVIDATKPLEEVVAAALSLIKSRFLLELA